MSAETFVDANLLIYGLSPESEWCVRARERLEALRNLGVVVVASPQVLREVAAVLTRDPPRGRGLNGVDAIALVEGLAARLKLVHENESSHQLWCEFLRRGLARGSQVHDANIVATMVAHGVTMLLTHNVSDFRRFGAWIQVEPLVPGSV